MIRTQRIVATLYLLLLASMFLWVPWKAWDRYRSAPVRLPYGFIWSGPLLRDWMTYEQRFRLQAQVDLTRVGLEAVALTAALGAVFCLATQRPSRDRNGVS